jgi:hypothetical protein
VDGVGLFAVLDEAQYALRPSGVDRFTTISGQTVRFPRDGLHGASQPAMLQSALRELFVDRLLRLHEG